MSATVLVGSVLGLAVAALYGWLGREHARRATTGGLGPAAFAVFWYGIAAHAAVESLWAVSVVLWTQPLWVGILVLLVKIGTGVAAIGGLVLYMLLIYTGNARAAVGVVLAYSALQSLMTWEYLSRVPLAPELRTWYAGLRYQHPEGAAHDALAVALFLPPLVAAVAYLSLLRVTTDPLQRRRIVATSASLAVFFGGFLLGWVHERWFWWGLLERVLALGAAAGVLAASLALSTASARPMLARG